MLVNPTGRFEIGGPMGDAGLTGRKIIVDTYGGVRNALGCEEHRRRGPRLPLRGAGRVRHRQGAPVGLFIETFGTATVPHAALEKTVREVFDLRPAAIIPDLDLLRPSYAQTAAFGHFGRELPELT